MAEKFALAATREERQKILFAAKSWAAEKVNNEYKCALILISTSLDFNYVKPCLNLIKL